VDIIGLDNYGDVGRSGPVTEKDRYNFTEALKLITAISRDKNKVAALTETGLEGVKIHNWFTDIILKPLIENQDDIAIAWILVWRNANTKHHYASYKGHESVADFQKFRDNSEIFFLNDLNKAYRKNKMLK
jgi:mannan endo-1,4-beta-mannosidase